MLLRFLQESRDDISEKLIYAHKRRKFGGKDKEGVVVDDSDVYRGQIMTLDQLLRMPDLLKDQAMVNLRKQVEQQNKEQE